MNDDSVRAFFLVDITVTEMITEGVMVLARDPSTRLLDGLFHLWTGKKIN